MILFSRPIVFLIAPLTANAAVVRVDSAAGVRERKVDVAEGVSLQVIKAGQGGSTLVFILAGAQVRTFGSAKSRLSQKPDM